MAIESKQCPGSRSRQLFNGRGHSVIIRQRTLLYTTIQRATFLLNRHHYPQNCTCTENSKVLRIGTQPKERIKVGEQDLEEVVSFCYLGSAIILIKRTTLLQKLKNRYVKHLCHSISFGKQIIIIIIMIS